MITKILKTKTRIKSKKILKKCFHWLSAVKSVVSIMFKGFRGRGVTCAEFLTVNSGKNDNTKTKRKRKCNPKRN